MTCLIIIPDAAGILEDACCSFSTFFIFCSVRPLARSLVTPRLALTGVLLYFTVSHRRITVRLHRLTVITPSTDTACSCCKLRKPLYTP